LEISFELHQKTPRPKDTGRRVFNFRFAQKIVISTRYIENTGDFLKDRKSFSYFKT